MSTCPYCTASDDDAWGVAEEAIVLPVSAPLAPGHCVVAPRRHASELFELDVQEQQAVWRLIAAVRTRVKQGVDVQAFFLGFVEFGAGEGHMHVHVVPQGPGGAIHLPERIEWIRM